MHRPLGLVDIALGRAPHLQLITAITSWMSRFQTVVMGTLHLNPCSLFPSDGEEDCTHCFKYRLIYRYIRRDTGVLSKMIR